MYTPPFNAVDDETEIRAMVAAARVAWFVTNGEHTPVATLLPIMWKGSTVVAHLAKANSHWTSIVDGAHGLLIVTGPDAYVSPTWYASKSQHGRVVPTWNYSAVQLTGTVAVRHDTEFLLRAVSDLTATHESGRDPEWSVTDAPDAYVTGQLNGIVGIEFTVTGVTGKAKLSQNRSAEDQAGVAAGLAHEPFVGANVVSDLMTQRLNDNR
jgi:transcriptional regulator